MLLNRQQSPNHMIVIDIGHIVIAEEGEDSIHRTIFIIVCIDEFFQASRCAIKLITIYDGIGAFFFQTHIHINGGIVCLLIDLLNHIRDLFILIGRSESDSTDIREISFFINLMEILRRLQSFNDLFLHIIEHIQNISLTEFRETRIIFNLMNKLISCNDHSGSTITDFFDQIVASIFDKAIEGIVKRLAKTKTIHNGPTIFCDVMGRSIIDDSGPTKRTKCIFQNFCSSM